MSQFIVFYSGLRCGCPGSAGSEPPSSSLRVLGDWESGETYEPGAAVVAPGTADINVNSLFIQRETTGPSISVTPPRDDLGRWLEIGTADLTGVLAGLLPRDGSAAMTGDLDMDGNNIINAILDAGTF